jgi:TetR/AcrR family transcriptional regulator, transcriptional repressor for nem operon
MIGDAVAPPTRCLPSFYAYSTGAQAIVQEIAAHPSPVRSDANRIQTALGLFTTLVSSLQLARAVTDTALSDQVLATGIRNALRVLDDWE